jgi:hypothetical protein
VRLSFPSPNIREQYSLSLSATEFGSNKEEDDKMYYNNSGTKYQNRSSGGWPLPKSDDLLQILYRIKSAAQHGASSIVSRFFSVILHVRSLDRGENCKRE